MEQKRLEEDKNRQKYWRRWGPYLSERQWGTVREDYSPNGDVWNYFTFDQTSQQIYRWGEDGIGGLCDNHGSICFSLSLWNGKDPILKERLFGLSNPQGNHGEDVKELYYYLDNTPTHSYMKYLYKYPQNPFPYKQLIEENAKRTQKDREFELLDTKIFDKDEYFDVFIEYAKETPDDIVIKISICNRANTVSSLHLLPTLWLHNDWKWEKKKPKTLLQKSASTGVELQDPKYGKRFLYGPKESNSLFAENDSDVEYGKDAFHRYLIEGKKDAINPKEMGTKAALHQFVELAPGEKKEIFLRFTDENSENPFTDAEKILQTRKKEADAFYDTILPKNLSDEHRLIARQAFAGMLWNKQYYNYVVERWLSGDPPYLPSNEERKQGRNWDWEHIYIDDVLSVPDKWEYPGLFTWDTAFHALPFAVIDPDFIKVQLSRIIREWYMHPSGALPSYEWNFDDVNPPVHSWACWRVYKIERKMKGKADRNFLESVFHKLLLNFTWWINRKDAAGKNVFHGGFLGLDNISVFNRSENLPRGAELYQSDATSWMAMYCLNMLAIALELAEENPVYESMASKFYEHFLYIADAINYTKDTAFPLWDEEDGFYYDVIRFSDGTHKPLKVRSLVGLMPLLAVMTIKQETLDRMKGFDKRLQWFINNRTDLCEKLACMKTPGVEGRHIMAIVEQNRLRRVLSLMLDENEFLSPYGIRSISKYHKDNPFRLKLDDHEYSVDYEPGESSSKLFGGNSNWRGPIWFPLNILLIESLQKFHHYHGENFKVECPTGSGNMMDLWQVACFLSKRLLKIFTQDESGKRPVYADRTKFQKDANFKNYIHFHEYFHGDTGEGLGASHQTGWTGLISKLILQLGEHGR